MFIKAKKTGLKRTAYWDENGATVTHVGGNRTWRNNNPGNIGAGPWAERHGAIGKAERFAVFPDYATGRGAIFDRLKSPDFVDQTIWDAIPHYAPAKENDVKWYRNGTITHYFVSDLGWLSKAESIRLTSDGKIDAVVAHSGAGTAYLRSRPDKNLNNNLGNLG